MAKTAKVDSHQPGTWKNYHQNVIEPVDTVYDIYNPLPLQSLADLQLTIKAIQKIIQDALTKKKRLRAVGGKWSLSHAAVTDGNLIQTNGGIAASYFLKDEDIHVAYGGPHGQLVYAQGGVSVLELNRRLKLNNLSLKAAGASNGQTIAGATATGTHGAAFAFGALHDAIVAIQIINSPTSVVWIERKTKPVVSQAFLTKMGSTLIQDDDLFKAVLVHVGCMGFVHGVVLETEPLFLLNYLTVKKPLNAALLTAMSTFDPMEIGIATTKAYDNGDIGRLYHFEVIVNPNDIKSVWVRSMYKLPYRSDYKAPLQGGMGPGPDLLSQIGHLQDFGPGPIGAILKLFSSKFLPDSSDVTGTFGEIFSATDPKGEGTSMEIGFDPINIPAVIDALKKTTASEGAVASFAGMRFVKASEATIAFTHFAPITCTLEMLGVNNQTTQNYYDTLWGNLDTAGIPYTFHWGQVNNLTLAKTQQKYTAATLTNWKTQRAKILSPEMIAVFSSPYSDQCGLTP